MIYKLIEYKPETEYPYAQGFCITDRFIYIVNILDNAHEVVYQYDKYTCQFKKRIPFTGLIRHGNDLAWNPYQKLIYCASAGGSKEIAVFDEQFNHLCIVYLPFDIVSLSGVAYDPVSRRTAIYGGSNHKIYIIKNPLECSLIQSCTHEGNSNFQGLAFHDSILYGCYSSGKIMVMNMNGDTIETTKIHQKGEMENLKILNGKVFYNIQAETSGVYYENMSEIVKNPMV